MLLRCFSDKAAVLLSTHCNLGLLWLGHMCMLILEAWLVFNASH